MSERTLALLLAILALLSGPLVDVISRRVASAYAAVDGLVLTAIGGVVLVHVLPHTFEAGGLWAGAAVVFGALGPLVLHRGADHDDRGFVMVLGAVGLAIHSMIDGAALSMSDAALSWAVVMHRVPAGIFVWWLVRPSKGAFRAGLVLGAIALATVVGFFVAGSIVPLEGPGIAIFEAFVAGMLLHVVVGHGTPRPNGPHKIAGAVGAVVGVLFVVWLPEEADHAHGAVDTFFTGLADELARTGWAAALGLGVLVLSKKRAPIWIAALAGIPIAAAWIGLAPAGVAALAIVVMAQMHAPEHTRSLGRAIAGWVVGVVVYVGVLSAGVTIGGPAWLWVIGAGIVGAALPVSPFMASGLAAATVVLSGDAGAAVALLITASTITARTLRNVVPRLLGAWALGLAVHRFLSAATLPEFDTLTFVGIAAIAALSLAVLFDKGPRGFLDSP